MVANPRMLGHFVFNSDYPVDKIVWLKEGQYTSSSSDMTLQNIYISMGDVFNSNLTIFVKGAVTVDNWATSIMIGALYSRPGKSASVTMAWESTDGGRIHLTSDMRSYKNKTIKYRLWGVVRDDIQQAVDYPKNATVGKTKLVFNSELNYPRLYKDGVAKSGQTVYHNLGKIPYVDYWYITQNSSGTVTANSMSRYWSYRPSSSFGSGDYNQGVRATDTTLTFKTQRVDGNNGIENRDVFYYYRIYA